ncbi:MAG: class I tRNA ligase family protein, partial [Candidatus Helarchaeota archaeon]|nr:class I tRNA ligase family protein [Candidatus Helarchaeota archaeon]
EKFGADALRQWGALGSLGDDYPYNPNEIDFNLRFLTKLWNACRFLSSQLTSFDPSQISETKLRFAPIDEWILGKLNTTIGVLTDSFREFNFHTGLLAFRQFFWHDFCDDYLEAVKYRLYEGSIDQTQKDAGLYTIYNVILDSLKLFAPVAPFITEEIYHAMFKKAVKVPSIHLSSWPTPRYRVNEPATHIGASIVQIISEFRKEKSQAGISLNTPIKRAIIKYQDALEGVDQLKKDAMGTLKIAEIIITNKAPAEKLPYHFEIADKKLDIYWDV